MKNLPDEWTDVQINKLFQKFGWITSTYSSKSQAGLYAFICFGTSDETDREYGPKCAAKAV